MQIRNKADLEAAIMELEQRKLLQEKELMEQFKTTRESLQPMNLIKETLKKITNNSNIPEELIKTITGIAVALLSKKMLMGKSSSLFRKILAGALEFAVAKSTISNLDKVKAYGTSIYNNLFRKKAHHQT